MKRKGKRPGYDRELAAEVIRCRRDNRGYLTPDVLHWYGHTLMMASTLMLDVRIDPDTYDLLIRKRSGKLLRVKAPRVADRDRQRVWNLLQRALK